MKKKFTSGKKPKIGFVALLLFFCGLFSSSLSAQNMFWGNTTGDNNWATAANWSGATRSAHTANFSTASNDITIAAIGIGGINSLTTLVTGLAVVGPGIPANTTITDFSAATAIVGTTITLSNTPTATGTASLIYIYSKSAAAPTASNAVFIENSLVGSPVISTAAFAASVALRNSLGAETGTLLTIDNILGASLTINSATQNSITLAGGSIVNNRALNLTSTATTISSGITTTTPIVQPTVANPREYGYSGTGTLSINIGASTTANSSAFNNSSTNAFTTYRLSVDKTKTSVILGPSTSVASFLFRSAGGTGSSPIIIEGSGVTLGSVGSPVRGGLLSVAGQGTVTINPGTTLELNSLSGNITNGIALGSNTIGVPTTFTNNGTINIFGESLKSGINAATTVTANDQDIRINIVNGGTINVDLACVTPSVSNPGTFTYSGEAAYKQSQAANARAAGAFFTNSGTVTLKNRSTVALTGYAIWGSGAGQRMPTTFTNSSTGILNIEGSINSIAQGFTLTNNGTVNSNNSIAGFTAFTNNAGASVNFGKTPAIFTVLGTAAATEGSTYRDDSFNVYTIRTTKVNGAVLQLLAETAPIAAIPASGVLTFLTGSGDATIDFSAVTGITTTAIGNTTTNAGIINTGKGSGASLSAITGVTTTTATSVIAPGGATEKGIATFSAATQTILGKLNLQVTGNSIAGVDFDQITNSAGNGGFDISAATLEITSLYTPSSSAVIPIVVASGSGTILGPFASVTGLTAGWTLSYASPTAVNLIYTVVVIPTIWTGEAADNNFFTEANWRYSGDNSIPAANAINPGANINLHLQINSAATTITSGEIQFGTGSLAVGSANLSATSLSGGTVTVNEGGYVTLSSATPLLNNVQINFTSGIGWIKTPSYTARNISTNNLAQIKVNNVAAVYKNNLRLDHYYLNGCVIRANLAATTPLIIYDGTNLGGPSAPITVNTIHSSSAIPNAMNNKIESFLLKKGFMATLSTEIDGTGKSRNYIASEADLVINSLPNGLKNSISFIRVLPWNWVTKKGRTDVGTELNTSWVYKWNNNLNTTLDWEYAPMSWAGGSADDATDIALYVGKYNSTHVMSFNEPDNCFDQSGQYGTPKLCVVDEAVRLHKNLMKTGMRIVSPGGREEAPFGWLEEFYSKATLQDIRIDVIAVHWYDWGDSPTTNDGATGDQVFNRFKSYLTNVHNLYGLPIWITEFNANPARSQAVNARFLELALPYLEDLEYIERYNWFPYNSGTHFSGWNDTTKTQTDTIPSLVGTIYKNINNLAPTNSKESIPEPTINGISNVSVANQPNIALQKPATSSSTYLTNVSGNAVDGDKTTDTSRWLVQFSTNPLPAWLEVDLQGSFIINGFKIVEGSNAVKDFQFQIWDTTLNGNAGGWALALPAVANNPATPLTTTITISPVVTTSKVRLYITAHNSTDFLRMYELEVYGVPSSPIWTGGTSIAWTVGTNWSTGIVPDQFSNVTIASGTPFQPTISTTVKMNSLTIATGASVTVNSGVNLTITDAITNNGSMTIASDSNLLQGGTFNNSGNIIVNRNSNPLSRLDYTIWSSPVTNANQFLTTFSPQTTTTRFYNYSQFSNVYTAVATPSTTPFALASGYLIRMPNTAVTAPATQTFAGVFTGIPNNGTIEKVLTYRNESPFNYGYNMVGNPYPSTLDADDFIAANTSRIESSLYFWRKTNGASGSAYAMYNASGSTATPSSPSPNGTIQVGQGFFVKAKNANPVTFTNAMRLVTTSTQFFKTKQVEKDRVWLNLTNTSGVFSQALIGYIPGATQGVDDFDGIYINDSPIALTSNINNEEYTIQGRPVPFDASDVVGLNFKTDVAGDYTIALDHFDGVFANGQDVYLVDSKTGIETDLKAAAYTFTAVAGVDNARFSLKYQKTLKVDAPVFNENSVRVYKNNGTLYVNSGVVGINNIKVYDIQGRLIAEQKNVKATTTAIKDLKAAYQVLIVKITGEDNSVVSKKVLY